MASKSVKRSVEQVNPMFNIPPGVDELVYDGEYVDSPEVELNDFSADVDSYVDNFEGPPTPTILGVVPGSERLRTVPGGYQVVDLLIEVDDIAGISKYEIRVVKK